MGLPARRTQSEAFRVLANNPGVARVAYSQLIQLLENNKFDTRLCPSVRARRDGGVAEQHRDRVDDGVVYREDKLTVPQFAPIVSASAQGQ
jgi:hypothetical protein